MARPDSLISSSSIGADAVPAVHKEPSDIFQVPVPCIGRTLRKLRDST